MRLVVLFAFALAPIVAYAGSFDRASREVNVKIVYDGPYLAGKEESVRYLHLHLKPSENLRSVRTDSERVYLLDFDYLPAAVDKIRGFNLRVHLYTVGGPTFWDNNTLRTALKGADGVVFVADANPERVEANTTAFEELRHNLTSQGLIPAKVPLVVQVNHASMPKAKSLAQIRKDLGLPPSVPMFATDAALGTGVEASLAAVTDLVAARLRR